MTPGKLLSFIYVALFLIHSSVTFAAELPTGNKTISLINNTEQLLDIGEIEFMEKDGNTVYKINFSGDVFQEEFLSMRPFKCIHHENQMVCNLVYPYEKLGYITSDDLMDLEYDLLFLHKSAEEYGINAWNGMFYELTLTPDGFEGTMKEVDLNVLVAPPEDGVIRPVTRDMLHEANPEHHLYPRLKIH